jgi:hypothetical protein
VTALLGVLFGALIMALLVVAMIAIDRR